MLHKFRFLIIFIALILFSAGMLFAQAPGPAAELRFGTWVPGRLQEGEEQWFSVLSPDTGFVVVETDGDTDTYLEAYDSSGKFLAEDDDGKNNGDENYNALLEIMTEAGKTYLFKLRCSDDAESGPYRIRASFEAIPADTKGNTRN